MTGLPEQERIFLCDSMGKVGARPLSPTPSSSSSSSSLSSSNSSFGSDTDTDNTDTDTHTDNTHTHHNNNKYSRRSPPRMRRKAAMYDRQCPQFPARKCYMALDCEMVGVGVNSTRSSLARVVIIDWKGARVFDEYIQQSEPVTDYRTFVSGITEQNLQQATCMTLHECRMRVSQILFGHILVGHGLENDLQALGINHPWWMIRDTACYEPFMNQNARYNMLLPRKLKALVFERLGKKIQEVGKPHNPYEDARWAMNLYKSVRSDWEPCVQYMVQRSMIESSIGRLHSQRGGDPHYSQNQDDYPAEKIYQRSN